MLRAVALFFTLCFLLAGVWARDLTPPPTCGLLCLKDAILASPCGTNQTCICTDAQLTATAQRCVLSKCTIKESLSTMNYSMASCDAPIRDESWETLWLGMSFFILSVFVFVVRVVSRLVGKAGFHWDDYTIIGAIIAGAGFAATSVPLYWHGLGRDIWTLPFDDITKMLKAYYHGEWVYAVAIFFTKMSLLLFYLRVFPAESFKIQIYVIMAVLVIYSILAVVVSCNQCTPVWGAWEYWSGEYPVHCLDRNALGWSSAVINMALDISIIVVPLRPLSKLAMSKKKKVQVILMFLVGAFVTIVSIIRLQSLIHFSQSSNATWDYRQMGYWSQIEIHVGNVCACMPAVYSLIKMMLPSIMGSTGGHSRGGMRSGGKAESYNTLSVSRQPRIREDHEQNFVRLDDFEPKGGGEVKANMSPA